MTSLRRYIADEARHKLKQELDTSSWPIRCARGLLSRSAHGGDWLMRRLHALLAALVQPVLNALQICMPV